MRKEDILGSIVIFSCFMLLNELHEVLILHIKFNS